MTPPLPRKVLAEGQFARLVARRGWEWVERVNSSGAVVIIPVTGDGQLVMVEQYRVPLDCRVIELPAGLVGDVVGSEHEALAEAARRELLEETGCVADSMEELVEGPSSAGLSSERYALLLARNVRRVGTGGGDDSEDIQTHIVPLSEVETWLDAKRRQGIMVDPKIFAGLYFAQRCRDDEARA